MNAPDPMLERMSTLNSVGTISYVLHLLVAVGALIPGGQWGPVLLLVALVIDLSHRTSAQGTWHHSHFAWRIRSVMWCGAAYVLTAPLWLLFFWPGWVAWLFVSIWFLVRIIMGFMSMNAGRPMPY
jgi:uncharacterized membrane protein